VIITAIIAQVGPIGTTGNILTKESLPSIAESAREQYNVRRAWIEDDKVMVEMELPILMPEFVMTSIKRNDDAL
jgi:hypothetical protein